MRKPSKKTVQIDASLFNALPQKNRAIFIRKALTDALIKRAVRILSSNK